MARVPQRPTAAGERRAPDVRIDAVRGAGLTIVGDFFYALAGGGIT